MFKKIALYSMLFVLVTLSTAAVVVFLNKRPTKPIVGPATVSEENMALTNLMNATMGVDNYKGNVKLKSTDGTVDLTGAFSVLDLANNARADVIISGVALGKNISVEIKYKDGYIYGTYGNFGIKIKAADLTDEAFINEIVGLVSKFINTDSDFDFNVDAIMEDLAGLKVEKLKDGYRLSLSLTGIGVFTVQTDADYLPLMIDAPEISLMGKTFNVYVEGQQGAASEVMVSENEDENYINVSDSKDLITGIIRTIKQTPVVVSGQVLLLGQSVNVSALIDSNANISASVSLSSAANICINVVVYEGDIFVNACGAKLTGSLNDLTYLLSAYMDADVDALLNSISMGQTSLSVAGIDFDFTLSNGYLSALSFEHAIVSGNLKVENALPTKVSKPQGFDEALTFAQAKDIVMSYANIANSNKISFSASGSVYNSSIALDLNGFVDVGNSIINGAYVSGSVVGKRVGVWYQNQKAYISFENNKICFTTQFAGEIIEQVMNLLSVSVSAPQTDLAETALKEIKSLSIDPDGTIAVSLNSGLVIEARTKSNGKELKVCGKYSGIDVDCTVFVYNLSTKYERAYKMLRPSVYTDITAHKNLLSSVLNTAFDRYNTFEGEINLNLLDIVNYTIGIKIEIERVVTDFDIRVELTNLPTTCLITNTTVFKYSSQRLVIEYHDGLVSVQRFAKRAIKNQEDKVFDEVYSLKRMKISDLYDIVGLGGLFGGNIKSAIDSAMAESGSSETAARQSLNSLISLNAIQNGILVELQKSALPDALQSANVAVKTDGQNLSEIALNIITKGYVAIIRANFVRVK